MPSDTSNAPEQHQSCGTVLASIVNITGILMSPKGQYKETGGVLLSIEDVSKGSREVQGSDFASGWGVPARDGLLYADPGFESGDRSKEEVRVFCWTTWTGFYDPGC